MRSRLRFFVVALLVAGGVSAADLADLRKTGTLRVLVVAGSPAFFELKPAGNPGLDREILDGFARLEKLQIEPVEVPSWDGLVPALLSGKGDLIAGGVTVTPARARQIDFSVEVFPTRHVGLTRRPHRVLTTLLQLREEKIGTIRGSSMAEAIASAGVPPSNVDDSLPSGGLPDALRKGRITATVSGLEDAFLYQRDDPAIQIGVFVGAPGSLAFGVRKDAPQLKAALDQYVSNLRRTSTWNRLVLKYFGSQAPDLLKRVRAE